MRPSPGSSPAAPPAAGPREEAAPARCERVARLSSAAGLPRPPASPGPRGSPSGGTGAGGAEGGGAEIRVSAELRCRGRLRGRTPRSPPFPVTTPGVNRCCLLPPSSPGCSQAPAARRDSRPVSQLDPFQGTRVNSLRGLAACLALPFLPTGKRASSLLSSHQITGMFLLQGVPQMSARAG